MNSCEFATAVSAMACCIAKDKSADEIAFISAVMVQLGDTLATIAAHEALCSKDEPRSESCDS